MRGWAGLYAAHWRECAVDDLRQQLAEAGSRLQEQQALNRQYEQRLLAMVAANTSLKDKLVELSAASSDASSRELRAKVAILEGKVAQMSAGMKQIVESHKEREASLSNQLREETDLRQKLGARLQRAMEDMDFYRKVLRERGAVVK